MLKSSCLKCFSHPLWSDGRYNGRPHRGVLNVLLVSSLFSVYWWHIPPLLRSKEMTDSSASLPNGLYEHAVNHFCLRLEEDCSTPWGQMCFLFHNILVLQHKRRNRTRTGYQQERQKGNVNTLAFTLFPGAQGFCELNFQSTSNKITHVGTFRSTNSYPIHIC